MVISHFNKKISAMDCVLKDITVVIRKLAVNVEPILGHMSVSVDRVIMVLGSKNPVNVSVEYKNTFCLKCIFH